MDDAVFRILRYDSSQVRQRVIVFALRAKHSRIEEMRPRQVRRKYQSLIESRSRSGEIAFLNEGAADIDETIRIFRIGFGRPGECRDSTFQVSLKQQADAVIIPSSPVLWINAHGVGVCRGLCIY